MVYVLIDFIFIFDRKKQQQHDKFKVFCSLKDKLLWYMNDIEALNLKYTKEITVSV